MIFLIIGIVALTLSFLRMDVSLCLFYSKFHIPCPACGITRAFRYFLDGNIVDAFSIHPLFWVVPFIPVFAALDNEKYLYTLGSIFIIVWIARLIITYPTFY